MPSLLLPFLGCRACFALRLRGISAIGVGGVFSRARMTASNSPLGTLTGLSKHMPETPEQKARREIDINLAAAGFV